MDNKRGCACNWMLGYSLFLHAVNLSRTWYVPGTGQVEDGFSLTIRISVQCPAFADAFAPFPVPERTDFWRAY